MSSYYTYDDQAIWYYAHAVVVAVIAVPIAVLGVIICFKGGKRADPARTGFLWLKATFALHILSLIFTIVHSVALGVWWGLPSFSQSDSTEWSRVSYAMSAVSNFFFWFANMTLLISFVEIGNGFLYALTQLRSRKDKVLRYVTFALMIPLIVMTFVDVGYGGALWSQYSSSSSSYGTSRIIDKMDDLNNVAVTMNILYFIYSLLAMVHASVVRHKYRGIEPSGKTVTLYLVATVLNLVPRSLWGLVYSCLVTFNNTFVYLEVDVPTRVVMTQLVALIVLTLLYVVATRKQAGLWTTLQPWMNGVPPTLIHRQQLYYGIGPNGQPAYYQYAAAGQAPGGYAQPVQTQYYGWQPEHQQQQPYAYEAPGVPPNVVPAGDHAHMPPGNGPEWRPAEQVHHEMKA